MGVLSVDAVDFLGLAGGKGFGGVEAEGVFEEALTAEDFEEAGDAAGEIIGGVEEGGVAVGDLWAEGEEVLGDGQGRGGAVAFGEEVYGAFGPDGPVAEEAADDSADDGPAAGEFDAVRSEEVQDDVVVVAGVEGDVGPAGVGDGADDVEGLVAVEGGNLDGQNVGDFGEASPEGVGEDSAADGGLEVEADEGDTVGDGAAVGEELVF